MSTHGSIKAVNILANAFDRLISRLEYSAPDQLSLDGYTYCFQHRSILAVSISAHRWNDVVCFTAFFYTHHWHTDSPSVCVLDQSWRGLPDRNRFFQGTDGKRLLHPLLRLPADTPTRIEIDTDGQIQPARADPDISDIRAPHF